MITYPLHGSNWFDVREFVDERTWDILGLKAAWMIDPRIVRVADLLREKAGVPVIVNNWHIKKKWETLYDSSGYRSIWDKTGGTLSQHRCGRAADFKVQGFTPRQMMILIQANAAEFRALGLTTMEDVNSTPTWLHCDCRPIIPGIQPELDFLIVRP